MTFVAQSYNDYVLGITITIVFYLDKTATNFMGCGVTGLSVNFGKKDKKENYRFILMKESE